MKHDAWMSECFGHTIRREPSSPLSQRTHVVCNCAMTVHVKMWRVYLLHSTRGRNWQFLQDKVPPLLVQIQAPADNQFESMLASIHVSLPGHNSRQLMNIVHGSHGSTWKNCCVFSSHFVSFVLHQSTRDTKTDFIAQSSVFTSKCPVS